MNFDIDRYLDRVERLDDRDIDYDHFRESPLHPDALRVLRYMHDIESHTVCYQRDLLLTRAHDDPGVTAFLTMWAYEEHWHGVALGKVLAAHGEASGRERAARLRAGRRLRAATSTLVSAIGGLASSHVTAVHMTWGAVNEWTTQAAYLRLAERAGDPTLATLLRRIARQEGRHIDFYASESERRLGTGAAQRLTRAALARLWAPVGSGVLPARETRHVVRYLFGGPAGASIAERIDRRVDRLPGLGGLGLVAGARARYGAAA